MSFIWPSMLWILLTVPLIGATYFFIKRRRISMHSTGFGLLQGATRDGINIRRNIPLLFFLLGLTVLVVALARPQMVLSLPRLEGTVILAFDVSGSMAADDLEPTRMDAAKAAARGFVEAQPSSIQIGVVAFSGSGIKVQVPTDDREAILAAIERLTPEEGTSLAHGILTSLNAVGIATGDAPAPDSDQALAPITPPVPDESYTSTTIILLTDGENTAPPEPLAAAQLAADHEVRIYTVGVGSTTGTTLNVEGFTVHTQLDETMLRQISEITNGAYFNAASEQDLHTIYADLTPQLVIKPEDMEITSVLASGSILLLLIGGVFSVLWFNRLP